ncbi:MAG: class II fructose-bisphosphate aldolase, partial [Actinomycetes bacterium]
MPLATTADIVTSASRDGRGVGAFNMIQLEHAEAIVAGAADADRPVIMQVSENAVRYHGGLEPVALAALSIARHAAVPVAVHLDHATSRDLVDEAVRLG